MFELVDRRKLEESGEELFTFDEGRINLGCEASVPPELPVLKHKFHGEAWADGGLCRSIPFKGKCYYELALSIL